ncbi:tRNA (adenosine(37)-N6)-threonylcarbamoyltransferase complex dimerization subunit type 1 TsaB [Candidatus Dependentiae bacterium]|nr:tRNA (adenosine(37)-N6)-threonylcarbamoyltransferase complex dimerization subunit type 1 TsaB [Candidatus Dependentiae bacterium]
MQFITLQGTYNSLELGLFAEQSVVDVVYYDELRASSNLVPFLEAFLKKNKCSLGELSFIAVDKGPGAFTSLRATIASVNGIAYASKIRLIGINSLEALQVQAHDFSSAQETRYIASLLNAYNNDVYFRIFDRNRNLLVKESCQKIEEIIDLLVDLKDSALCVGNGLNLYRAELQAALDGALRELPTNPAVPSVQAIAHIAWREWQHNKHVSSIYSIEPYYLKTQLFAVKR